MNITELTVHELQEKIKKPADNVIMLPKEAFQFINKFLQGKQVEPMNSFKNLLVKIFS